ncbi:CAP domain-containing protein [Lottiidibacillus patelloidae]|nr:CAP domain-containing protein [Lottiidibacillus patelloidae]
MKGFFLFVLTAAMIVFFFFSKESLQLVESLLEGKSSIILQSELSQSNYEITEVKAEGIHKYVGMESIDALEELGEPDRIDPSAYGYEWWIYNGEQKYLQLAMKEGLVVSAFGFGDKVNAEPFIIGDTRENLETKMTFTNEVSFTYEGNSYLFSLTSEDLQMRPIVAIENGWAQLYFDTFTNKLSSVRYLNSEALLLHRPYTIKYRGTLIENNAVSREQWREIERANEQQVLSITNIIRSTFNVNSLAWHEEVANVAFKHSKDMSENNYFAHESPTRGNLGDRLKEGDVSFSFAGENIASNYVDALAAVEGWLNSEGHRKALLSDKYTHLGVGVFEKYYTQNFIKE